MIREVSSIVHPGMRHFEIKDVGQDPSRIPCSSHSTAILAACGCSETEGSAITISSTTIGPKETGEMVEINKTEYPWPSRFFQAGPFLVHKADNPIAEFRPRLNHAGKLKRA